MKTLYTAHVTSVGGRDGTVESDDKKLSVKLARTGNATGTNPEQLFGAGYSACFSSALAKVAQSKKVTVPEIKILADVSLNEDDNGYFLAVTLNVSLPGVDKQVAQDLVQTAHTVCPYSKATRGNIEVTLKVDGDAVTAKAA